MTTARIADALAPVLLVLTAAVVVTIATNGPDLLPPVLRLEGGWRWAIRIVGAAAVAGGLWVLLSERARRMADGHRGRNPIAGSLRTAGTIMGVLAVVAVLTRPPGPADGAASPGGSSGAFGWIEASEGGRGSGIPSRSRGGTNPVRGSRLEGGQPPPVVEGVTATVEASEPGLFRRVAGRLAPLLILLLIAAVAYRAFMRRIAPRAVRSLSLDAPTGGGAATAALEDSLDPLTLELGDPRGLIAAAYHRLLQALAAAGAPREPWEAPHEHLHRALGPLGVRFEPLHRLAGLYVMAEFSDRPVTERHRAQAREALEDSLADLRAARRPSGGYTPAGRAVEEGAP